VELRIIRLVFTLLFVGFLTWWAVLATSPADTTTWPFFVAAIIFGGFSLALWVKEADDQHDRRVKADAPGPRGHGALMIGQAHLGALSSQAAIQQHHQQQLPIDHQPSSGTWMEFREPERPI
jgi:hypothetical protein